jgi:general nucleoside transport system ATP-binding protein
VTDTDPAALALTGITKRFGTTLALQDVTLRIGPGRVHALLGENGAGKTTLMRVAFGMVHPDAGTVQVQGRRMDIRTPADAIAAGIGMVHQHFTLVPAMTVAENLALGGHGRLRASDTDAIVREIAEQTGFALDPSALIETLSVGAQQRVEIAKALARRAAVLVLDEPTAVLAPAETEELLQWIRRFVDAGNSVVLITHKLTEALSIADEVTVLRRGRVVLSGAAAATSTRALTAAMIGQDLTAPEASAARTPAISSRPIILAAHGVTVCDDRGITRLRDATITVRAGEIVGIAGVEGAGHRELLRVLAGRRRVLSGRLERPTQPGFVPEDRHRDAVLLDRTLTDNVALRGSGRRRGRIDWHDLRRRAQALMTTFDVRAPSPNTPMHALSGGNQQKLVLAREMERFDAGRAPTDATQDDSSALVVENPTRGLDVRATADVHARLRVARDEGMAIVVYSGDLDELLALADRVYVAYAGTLREVPGDRDAVGAAMLGLR